MKIGISAAFLAATWFVSTPLLAENYLRPTHVAQKEYEKLLNDHEFEKLDKSALDAKNNNRTTADGIPLLDAIYNGTAGCVTSQCPTNPSKEYWIEKKKNLELWAKKRPKSETAKVANAMYYLEYGWNARGTGGGNEVTEQQWQEFGQNLDKASEELRKLYKKDHNDPGFYSTLLLVALAQGWNKDAFDSLFDMATKSYPSYVPFYLTGASYHSPWWHGSVPELRDYATKAAEKTKMQLGYTMYTRAQWLITSGNMYDNGQADWLKMRAGFERIIKDYPDPWNINNFARHACYARDMRILPPLMKKIGDKPIMSAWVSDLLYKNCVTMANDVDPDNWDALPF